ncbi:MAG TPA: hypothetical protein VH815_03995 [Acidobacteriota bacterium]
MKKLLLFLFSLFLVSLCVIPADAWVGGGGGKAGPAVGPRGGSVIGPNGGAVGSRPYGGCCYGGYSGYDIAAPSTPSTGTGSTGADYSVTKAKDPNATFFVSDKPAESSAAIGTIEYSLPKGCVKTFTNGAAYFQCGSTYYKAVYQAGTLVYEAVKAPY